MELAAKVRDIGRPSSRETNSMDIRREFSNACREFPEFRGYIAKAQQETDDEATRQYLGRLMANMDEAFASLQEQFPAAISHIEAREAEYQALAKEVQQQSAEVEKILAEAKASADRQEHPATSDMPRMEPDLGPTLREELLSRFGGGSSDRGQGVDPYGDFWQEWKRD